VTINSTVGLTAAKLGCPVKTLGVAIYDRGGITNPQALSEFLDAPLKPDAGKVADFEAYLHSHVLVPGAFEGSGVGPGADNVAAKILAGPVFERGLSG